MWRLIIILLLLVASVWFGLEVVKHPGYIFIAYQPWMVQMPIWFALLCSIIFLALFYVLISSVDRLQFFYFRLKNWLRLRREHRSYSKTQHGLAMLIEGRAKKAETLLLVSVEQSIEPLMNYLGAAKAAHEQKAYERRDLYIQKAYQTAPDATLAIGLTQAELELEQGQLEHAIATLNHLRELSPRHPRVLKLLEKIYVRLSEWQNLLLLLPDLRKAKVLNSKEEVLFEKNIYCQLLQVPRIKTLEDLQAIWRQVPRNMKKNPDVVQAYVQQSLLIQPLLLTASPMTKEIEELIRKTLKHHWQPELVKIYGTLPFTQLNRQLAIVGAWMKMYGQKPELLLTLGRLCVRVQLWGKAKDYFEKCLALGPNPEALLAYGELLEHLHEPEAARQKYRTALAQLMGNAISFVNEQQRNVFENNSSLN